MKADELEVILNPRENTTCPSPRGELKWQERRQPKLSPSSPNNDDRSILDQSGAARRGTDGHPTGVDQRS